MKSKVAFLDQARKMPSTSIPALHLKRNIFECFRFFNFPFSVQFWRLNPSNFSSDFFAERYRPELTVGLVSACRSLVKNWNREPGLWVGGRRRSGEVGSWAGPPWAPTTPSSTRGRCGREDAADHGTWFVSRVERISPKCSTHLSICHMRFVALKGGDRKGQRRRDNCMGANIAWRISWPSRKFCLCPLKSSFSPVVKCICPIFKMHYHFLETRPWSWWWRRWTRCVAECKKKELQLDLKHVIEGMPGIDMRFVRNFTPPEFQAKTFTPSISPNFNSFSDKNAKKMSENGEIYTTGTTAGSNSHLWSEKLRWSNKGEGMGCLSFFD